MSTHVENQSFSPRGLAARTQSTAANALDDLLANVAQIIDEAASTFAKGDDDRPASQFGTTVTNKLHDTSLYLRERSGEDIVNSGIDIARRNPQLFVAGTAILAGLAAYFLITSTNMPGR